MQIAKILLPVPKLFPLDYIVPQTLSIEVGDLVIVSFKNKEITAIVWELNIISTAKKLKIIKEKVPLGFKLQHKILELIKWMSNYYLSELGCIAKLVLPVNIADKPIKIKEQIINHDFRLAELSQEQQQALNILQTTQKPVVIKGVTGSGKTEVYFNLIAKYLNQDVQILVMLPEIALSLQIINRFKERFGFEPIIWNSQVTKAEKKKILRGILSNQIKIIIGTRSSLLLPFPNLRLIVIDEEHDDSYKQDDGILYNARDTAIVRSKLANTKLVLCSATPAIETIFNIKIGKYQLVTLDSRYNYAAMPLVKLIDMNKERLVKNSYISEQLRNGIYDNISNKKQVLLFLNRRGYAPLMLCKACGYRFSCKFCSTWLVVHKSTQKLECHHCGYASKIHTTCPECKTEEDTLTIFGPGIERIEEEIRALFPSSKIAVMSKDHVRDAAKVTELLQQMLNQEIDILIGTQMITKGYHFPNLTLVGVIDADLGSNNPDLRANERTYQLLHQVGGRAGRDKAIGTVYLQSYNINNVIFTHIQNADDNKFFEYELATRQAADMPPFTKTAAIILSGTNEQKILEIAKKLVRLAPKVNHSRVAFLQTSMSSPRRQESSITQLDPCFHRDDIGTDQKDSPIRILGPATALISKLAGKYRYRILIITDRKFNLQKYLKFWLSTVKIPSYCHLKIDIDPKNFY